MAGVLIPNELEFNKVVASLTKTPKFHNKTKQRTLSDKKIEHLKEKVDKIVESIQKRNEWLEATKRKNYTHEHDRIQSMLSVLNKDRNAIGIKNLQDRMEHLQSLVKESMEPTKHEIYSKVEGV